MNKVVLQAQGLTKKFGSLTAVDELSLDVYQGEVFGLLGPNGAGKTTSISMICGLLEPDAGSVSIHGLPVHGGQVEAFTRVGVCPQETILWEKLTCLEQLEFIGEMYGVSRKVARQRGEELLALLGLSEKRDKLSATLSGGMKRRLNLALALVHDPEILVLDEPEAGLDPQSRVLVREYIRSLAKKKTIILTTHNMDEAERLADRVAIIDHGVLLVVDTPEELKRTIGEGDVLELEIKEISPEQAMAAIEEALPDLSLRSEQSAAWQSPPPQEADRFVVENAPRDDMVSLRGINIADKLPTIINAIQRAGGQVGEIHLRANTLEDVFIALTGRRLRE
ncbi:MAG: ABC transporter ATP-binding protein [Chloroflexi bacterium]|nr:ABC transporter ATP-binding protein [Chloroflexota bacterium]